MKVIKAVMIASCFLFSVCVLSVHAADVAKIGIVDFQKILENSDAGKVAQAEITKQGKKMEAELKKKGDEIEELKSKFERESLVMSKEKRDEKEREIRININDIKSMQVKFRSDFKVQENRLVIEIQNQVFDLVEKIGKEDGYMLIIEKREAGVMYHPNSIDITDRVIKRFNTEYANTSKP
ncbi:MAG: OmpH family outer membrane protein [Desulfobacterales bacterium]|nr:OmpH family outer membrane protein [Desulfobacterales bacterium]MDD4072917.1 OmpH family outer membrane protein [Desulfobacterales bacterium]MDD4392180.1 OmpH family outer membrane protein [Desulfobacterales bacterium]